MLGCEDLEMKRIAKWRKERDGTKICHVGILRALPGNDTVPRNPFRGQLLKFPG